MNASEKTAIITLLANLLAERLDEAQLVAASAILTQLGTTLGFLAAQQTSNTSGRTGLGVTAPSSADLTQAPSSQERTKRSPSQESGPSRKSPGPPEASSATGK